MFRTYKYLLRPNDEQAQALDFLLWQSRLIYNAALEQRISIYRETGKGIGYNAQWAHFRDVRNGDLETFGKLNASSLQHLLRRLDKAFQAFFRRVKAGETPGFPRFKARNRFKSIEYTYGDGCKLRQNEQGHRSFYIQNVGEVRMCFHRPLPEGATLKRVVIKRVNDRWYVCLRLETPGRKDQRSQTGRQVGVDVGLKSLLSLSNGELIENPRWMKNKLAKLRRAQRHASRHKKGSQRQRKTYDYIAHLHEQIANQRRDWLHKIANRLVTDFDLIAIEDLTLAFMNRNGHLSLASHDAGLGELRQLPRAAAKPLSPYKAEEAGCQLVAVNPANTSQMCSRCGRIVSKDLNVRVHKCPTCALILDRDVNAARNILFLALKNPPGRGGQTVTWAAAPSVV
jgi:putative transposase